MNTKNFTDIEICVFAKKIRQNQEGSLQWYKVPKNCIASALCAVGSTRSTPNCGTYASSIRRGLAHVIPAYFNKDQMEQILEFCMNEHVEKNVRSATEYLG